MKFFDCCAGIGSAHLAFKNLGLDCVGYSEIDKKAEETYKLFHGNSYKNYGDLMKVNSNSLEDFDILLAGFPCQAFSIAGKRKGFEDERGQIIYGLSEVIKIKKPKAFLLENVKGLVNINNGKTLKDIIFLLKECGYNVVYKVLESTAFGIPQARERVYFVGIRKDMYKWEFSFPNGTDKNVSLKSFLIDADKQFILSNSAYQTFLKYLDNKYNKGKYKIEDLLKQDYLVVDARQSDLRLYYNKIPTLRTGRQGILYIKDNQIRKLSGLEALLLQGFDLQKAKIAQENFLQSNILAQAGNAMTVNVMQEIGKSILEYLL
jgi:DNA (cytosine-5)-methyltransferase 1